MRKSRLQAPTSVLCPDTPPEILGLRRPASAACFLGEQNFPSLGGFGVEIVLKGLCSEKTSVKHQFVLPSLFAGALSVARMRKEWFHPACYGSVCSVAASFYPLITKCLRPQEKLKFCFVGGLVFGG